MALPAPAAPEPLLDEPADSEGTLFIVEASDPADDSGCEPVQEDIEAGDRALPSVPRCFAFRRARRRARGDAHEEAAPAAEEALVACDEDIHGDAAEPERGVSIDPTDVSCTDPRAMGLLYYKKWWFMREVGISVRGEMLDGTPVFLRDDALRVINDKYSYIIPIRNVDYIRTPDGLEACEDLEC